LRLPPTPCSTRLFFSAPISPNSWREGATRNAFANRAVVSILAGEPEYLAPLKDEAPTGWLVTGYPWSEIKTPAHDAFLKAYIDRFKESPNIGALNGYINTLVLAKAIENAGSTRADDLIKATEHLKVDTPVGSVAFRAIDHQSTMASISANSPCGTARA